MALCVAKETFVSRLEATLTRRTPQVAAAYGSRPVGPSSTAWHDPSEMERLLEKIKLEVCTAWAKESVAKA